MIPHTFPIAHFPRPVYLLSPVFSITFLLTQDDTPDVPLPYTYYATRTILRPTETFALIPTHLRDLRPFIQSSSYAYPSHCAPRHIPPYPATGETSARATQEHAREADRRVSTPLISSPPCAAPPYSYSSVSRETLEEGRIAAGRAAETFPKFVLQTIM